MSSAAKAHSDYDGTWYSGKGDVEHLRLLDLARSFFAPSAERQHLAMLYTPKWNGLVEGPKWGMWWIQNSYGASFCAAPFLPEPYRTFLYNSQACWFDTMGDGQREFKYGNLPPEVVPDGQLCDAATPAGAIYKQGDGRVGIHDWGLEFTAAGVVMQAEMLLIDRDMERIARDLPRLERSANFLDSRRDPETNLLAAGPAGNLLAPSYAGWKRDDGTYGRAYLAGLSVTYIAALDRLIELEKLVGNDEHVRLYTERRDLARQGLPRLQTDEGYFVKYIDPDGVRHGVYGAEKHGYFEAIVNHDAACLRVVDDATARKIYDKIASIPELRRNDVIITNHPGLDDMYEDGGIFSFGTWVNGGHWSTCEARAIMLYHRVGAFEDARKSMRHMMRFAEQFQLDNPVKNFGATPWYDSSPVNLCYDFFGPPAAFMRGLFEYVYTAEGLTLIPHIPPSITRLEQKFPVRLGGKRIWLSTEGSGPIRSVTVDGKKQDGFSATSITLCADALPDAARVRLVLGDGARKVQASSAAPPISTPEIPAADADFWNGEWLPEQAPRDVAGLRLRIGADSQGGSRLDGDIGHVVIYGGIFDDPTIAELASDRMQSGPLDPWLIGDWPMDGIEQDTLQNRAGNWLHLHPKGEGVRAIELSDGPAIRLGGEGFLEADPSDRLKDRRSLTLAAWVRLRKPSENGARIIDRIPVGNNDGFLLDTHPSGQDLRLITPLGVLTYAADLQRKEWTHVAAAFDLDARTMSLFLNGERVARSGGEAREGDEGAEPSDAQRVQRLAGPVARCERFLKALSDEGLPGDSYEVAHARLVLEETATLAQHAELQREGELEGLPDHAKRPAALMYVDTIEKLVEGVGKLMEEYATSDDAAKRRIAELWESTAGEE